MNTISTNEIFQRIIDIKIQLEAVKPLYSEMDALVLDLVKLGATEFVSNGITYVLTDNFAEKNTVFRPAGVKRFELLEVKPKKVKAA